MDKIGVLIPSASPRLQYILDYILSSRLGLEYFTFTDIGETAAFRAPLISYGLNSNGVLNFCSSKFLFEAEVEQFTPDHKGRGEDCVLFPMDEHPLGFDVFAAVFWVLSRYEEYLVPHEKLDRYGRMLSGESMASELGFLHCQIVEIWIDKLLRCLKAEFPDLEIEVERSAHYIPTFDVDHCFAFKSRGFLGSIRVLAAGLLKKRPAEFIRRARVILGREQDPYDTFEELVRMHENGHAPVFFWLLGDYGGLDKALSTYSKAVIERIEYVNENAILAIHPSVRSSTDENLLREELETLERIASQPVHSSRQHYLKFSLPQTFHSLWHLGIEKDFSMCFADRPGFRLGTAHPVPFFDLDENMEINLTLYSSALMDTSLMHYMKLSPEQAIEEIDRVIDAVNEHGGFLIPIWHNNSVSEYGEWKGWKTVYVHMLRKSRELWE